MSLSMDCESTDGICSLIDLELSLKHEDMMCMFVTSAFLQAETTENETNFGSVSYIATFWPIFSLLFLLFCRRALTIFTTKTPDDWPGLKLNEKFVFEVHTDAVFSAFPLSSFLFSRRSHRKTTNTDHTSMFEYINRITMEGVTKVLSCLLAERSQYALINGTES
jgi:hypothetical protein